MAETDTKEPVAKKAKIEGKEDEKDDLSFEENENGEKYVELSHKKRLTVREYKGSVLIDIREYYEDRKTDEMKPGKKGISLTFDQYETLKAVIGSEMIDKEIDRMQG